MSADVWTPGIVWAHGMDPALRRLVDCHEIGNTVEVDRLREGQWRRETMTKDQWAALCRVGRVVAFSPQEARA